MANLDQLKRASSLGERLAQNARAVDARYRRHSRWSAASTLVHARLQRSVNTADLFRRIELDVEALPFRTEHAATRSASPAKRVERQAPGAVVSRSSAAGAVSARLVERPKMSSVELPESMRSALLPALGQDVNRVRVHRLSSSAEHTLGANARTAPSAVALGANVFVRPGRGSEHSAPGRALLAHEAAHAVWSLQATTAVARSTAIGRALEERAAEQVAHGATHGLASAAVDTGTRVSAHRVERESMPHVSSSAASKMEPHPRAIAGPDSRATASSVRAMFGHEESASRAPAAAGSAPIDYESIKQAVLRDLLQQVRVDAERGG